MQEISLVTCCNDVNKTDRPNTTPTVRAICTFAVYFSVFRPFCRFTLVYEGHFELCNATALILHWLSLG